jgi:rhodanese-related sulfurtransferase
MDGTRNSISPNELYAGLGTASAPAVVDVRRSDDFARADRLIASAFHRAPDKVGRWWKDLSEGRSVVVHCWHGRQISQDVTAALCAAGVDAVYLEGGISAWIERGLPTRRNIGDSPGKWVTREHPKIDRVACPWLIKRFIDPSAEFIYVPASQVIAVAEQTGGIPYDIDGVEFTHQDERCSFDAILRIYDIKDPALDHLATIVRGADTSRYDLAAECAGLFGISRGLSVNFPDDHEMLKHGMVMYDALYAWCRVQQVEEHPRSTKAVQQTTR